MATPPNNSRDGERGLSLIEALVMVTVTALLALLLLPLASRAAGRNFSLAERALDAADAANAEAQVRALVRAMAQQPSLPLAFDGQAQSVTFAPSLATATACAPAGASTWVRLRIAVEGEGGRLYCEIDGRRMQMLRWSAGEARFSYSADGANWSTAWVERTPAAGANVKAVRVAPLVRFELSTADGRGLAWTERAGAAEGVAPPPAPS